MRRRFSIALVRVCVLIFGLLGTGALLLAQGEAGRTATTRDKTDATTADSEHALREAALRRARVWLEPAVPIEQARLDVTRSDPGQAPPPAELTCQFEPETASGTSPKFRCVDDEGEELRVKYGRHNPEVFAEVAATRLMSALGFPTDRLYPVQRIRCIGCPADPFPALQSCWRNRTIDAMCLAANVRSAYVDFTDAVVERRLDAPEITAGKTEGWSWKELQQVDAAAGGASAAEVDALRLMAVFLSHWDNKAENQRLVCLDEHAQKDSTTACARPLAFVQDLGGTFGPFKADLHGWRRAPVWADGATCRVSMRALPYGGSTFSDVVISEAGRAFLAERLARLSADQIRDLFEGAGFDRAPRAEAEPEQTIDGWVSAFEQKRRAIVERRCEAG